MDLKLANAVVNDIWKMIKNYCGNLKDPDWDGFVNDAFIVSQKYKGTDVELLCKNFIFAIEHTMKGDCHV